MGERFRIGMKGDGKQLVCPFRIAPPRSYRPVDDALCVTGRQLNPAPDCWRQSRRRLLGGHEAASLRRDIADILAGVDADRLAPLFLKSVARLWSVPAKSPSAAWIGTGESWYEAASLAAWLAGRIAAGQPTTLIRLGDGEGNFLPYAA
jgi:hypothetical protein